MCGKCTTCCVVRVYVCAVGGLLSYVAHQSPECLLVGWGSAAALALCSLAMSDMRYGTHGELGVKAAWGEQPRRARCGGGSRARGWALGC